MIHFLNIHKAFSQLMNLHIKLYIRYYLRFLNILDYTLFTSFYDLKKMLALFGRFAADQEQECMHSTGITDLTLNNIAFFKLSTSNANNLFRRLSDMLTFLMK